MEFSFSQTMPTTMMESSKMASVGSKTVQERSGEVARGCPWGKRVKVALQMSTMSNASISGSILAANFSLHCICGMLELNPLLPTQKNMGDRGVSRSKWKLGVVDPLVMLLMDPLKAHAQVMPPVELRSTGTVCFWAMYQYICWNIWMGLHGWHKVLASWWAGRDQQSMQVWTSVQIRNGRNGK